MPSKEKVEACRLEILDEVERSEGVTVIRFGAWQEGGDGLFFDGFYDRDGLSIQAVPRVAFTTEGFGPVQATVERGVSPTYAASVLRKYADILDGNLGDEVVNMGVEFQDLDHAAFDEDGEFFVCNIQKIVRESKNEHKREENEEECD